jgi:hypothetical protein
VFQLAAVAVQLPAPLGEYSKAIVGDGSTESLALAASETVPETFAPELGLVTLTVGAVESSTYVTDEVEQRLVFPPASVAVA